jgi:alpha-L-glutamate ligase-like protein
MALIEVVGEYFHIKSLEFSIFFPILIVSWLADRFNNEQKERGWKPPVARLFWTTFSIVLSYLVIQDISVMHFIMFNPETWWVILLVNLYIGVSVKFRLSEYLRFKPVLKKGYDKHDVLSLPVRNRKIIEKYNPRRLFPKIEKAEVKKTLEKNNIPSARTIAMVENRTEINSLDKVLSKLKDFVIKPSKSYGGEGIIVITGKKNGKYIDAKDKPHSLQQLKKHVAQIVEGQFSKDEPDMAIIEERVIPSTLFKKISYKGLPDVRVIVLEGFPVMAMSRLPTKRSGGKANLHLGAVIVGIRISDGKTTKALYLGEPLDFHPDTGRRITGIKIPQWNKILEIASRAQVAVEIGYAGVDIVMDAKKGPLVLEVNKRPGLGIQNVNEDGLARRIRLIEKNLEKYKKTSIKKKVTLARKWDKGDWKK